MDNMIKIGIASDIHLNFVSRDSEDIIKYTLEQLTYGYNQVWIAGDISTQKYLEFHSYIIEQFPIYYILGNHDRWYGNYSDAEKIVGNKKNYIHGKRIQLSKDSILVGINGWYDSRAGNVYDLNNTNDMTEIEDLKNLARLPIELKLDQLRKWSDNDSILLTELLEDLEGIKNVYILTHFPPWVDYKDNPGYYPWSVNVKLGWTIETIANNNPSVRFEVLAGHTHKKRNIKLGDNIFLNIQEAEYGEPKISQAIYI